MAEQRSILVVEDDRNLAETLVYNLEREGYKAGIARTGLEAITMTRAQAPDLLLLDVMLPELDGFEVCRVLRTSSTVPIIMLTAKDDEVDRVLGLESGADDYVVKPFSLRELMARIRAALRRTDMMMSGESLPKSLRSGDLELWPGSRSVTVGEDQIHLLPREFDLLLYLMQNKGIVLTRSRLLEGVWGPDYLGEERTVDVHIRRLRMKVEPDPADPYYIRTVYGVGYSFHAHSRRNHDA